MIARLRRRMRLLVIGVLVVVTAGIIFGISTANYRNVAQRADQALNVLSDNRGQRPDPGANAPQDAPPVDANGRAIGEVGPMPEGANAPQDAPPVDANGRAIGEVDPMSEGAANMAGLSNFYTVELTADGEIERWTSDREAMYTDEQVEAMTRAALATGKSSGRVGTQYFRLTEADEGQRLIVLDARLEHLAAQSVMRTTALVAGLACALLCAAAWGLIGWMVKPVGEAFERQKQFVWDASHEFKTPLAVISANAEVLAGEIGENEYLGYIQSEVRRADRLVQSLLMLARMDRGTVAATLERLDVSKALLGVALPFESTAFEAGRTLELDVPDGIFIHGDGEMIQQLAMILLSNALKYSDPRGTIRLTLRPKGRGCQFSVYNTGPGIAPENLERIFDRFYREDLSHSGEIAGNGLGLAIARNIVDAHKGRIWAESEPGRNATFVVAMP